VLGAPLSLLHDAACVWLKILALALPHRLLGVHGNDNLLLRLGPKLQLQAPRVGLELLHSCLNFKLAASFRHGAARATLHPGVLILELINADKGERQVINKGERLTNQRSKFTKKHKHTRVSSILHIPLV
jgi:hypothetical protein